MTGMSLCLWFDADAEAAANFYVDVFRKAGKAAEITSVVRYPEGAPVPAGTVMTVAFSLLGVDYAALNGGPLFTHSPAVSLVVRCDDQAEVDYFWDALLADGGTPSRCGWLTDRFGISWQVTPKRLLEMMETGTPGQIASVTAAFMPMSKLDLATIERAFVD